MPSSAFQTCALDRKSTRLNSSHTIISYAVFCLKKIREADHVRATVAQGKGPPVRTDNRQARTVRKDDRHSRRPSHRLAEQLEPDIDFFNDTATTEIYPLSLHDALPI